MNRYLMIGAPVTSVRTPPLLAARLAELGRCARVEVLHLEPADLAGFMTEFRGDPGIAGLLVTMPHKQAIAPHLDAVSPIAARAGSVNAVKRLPAGDLVGAQFDGQGLVRALVARGVDLRSMHVGLAGVGGAGLAIAQAILDHGCRGLTLAETDPGRRSAVEAGLARAAGPPLRWAGRLEQARACDLLINATPLGMAPGDPSPFGAELVARASHVVDIVADPPATRLAALAARTGATLVTGRDMVVGQVPLIARWLVSEDPDQGAAGDPARP